MGTINWIFDRNHDNLINVNQIIAFEVASGTIYARMSDKSIYAMADYKNDKEARNALNDIRMGLD